MLFGEGDVNGTVTPSDVVLQCTCTVDLDLTKVVRRRKGILKNGGSGGGGSSSQRSSLIDDARKQLSMGSLSSNSSADILDLSYDSGEGEPGQARVCKSSSSSSSNRNSAVLEVGGGGVGDHRSSVSSEAGDRNSFFLDGEFTAVALDGQLLCLEDDSLLLGPAYPPPPPPPSPPASQSDSLYTDTDISLFAKDAPLLDLPVPPLPPVPLPSSTTGVPLYPETLSPHYSAGCAISDPKNENLFDFEEAKQVLQQAANLLS
jgi:hypothetical protein